ncbi:MAG: cation:proton antiporter [Methanobrevibacter sp.]|nr:cation:proton antiporter [Methanobrevibacter sp.]
MIEYIQSALLIISAILIIISAVGLLTLGKNTKNVVYARIHIVGIFDVACMLLMIALGQYMLAVIYLIIAPFTAHAIANSYYKSEDRENNLDLLNVEEVVEDNPFIQPKDKIQALESEDSEKLKVDDRFSISTLEIEEE